MSNSTPSSPVSPESLVEPAIEMVASWLVRSRELESRADQAAMSTLRDLVLDERGVDFTMAFVDRVARPDDDRVAAQQLQTLVRSRELPSFLSWLDKALLRLGARLSALLPSIVMPLARRRMRALVGHLVSPSEDAALAAQMRRQRSAGYALNVNLLGEAVLGEREAEDRLERLLDLLRQPDVDYVSVKVSAVASQLNHWDHDGSLERVTERVSRLLDAAAAVEPPTFVNFDMEEYRDLHLTVDAFKAALSEPSRHGLDAGIVVQAYLPDSFAVLQDLARWANHRHESGGGTVKIRLVKGANLAMEQVEAAIHNWVQAPYDTKLETDANYRRCLDWLLQGDHLCGVRLGLASHNLFDIAWTTLLATERGVADKVQYEMLLGMAPGQAKAVSDATSAGPPLLLYTPAVARDDFDVAIGYLFRRLEENAAPENFLRAMLDLEPDSAEFRTQAQLFRDGVRLRQEVSEHPRRAQNRGAVVEPLPLDAPFGNQSDTDPALVANREWIESIFRTEPVSCHTPITTDRAAIDENLSTARAAANRWAATPPGDRRAVLRRAGDEIERRRGELLSAMMHEASKPLAEADIEVSEAVDFARYYADRAVELDAFPHASFTPFGVVGVVPPWNFPTAIPAGGMLASLAAGNAVICKPAPETPRCAEIVAEACWAAGVPRETLQFVRTPDDDTGRHLIESVDAVILTGSTETAELFRSWDPRMRLFAETSGKNALIVTPSADLDLAAQDLIRSAFGHGGQKCSAASIAILVGDVYASARFRRQLVDAASSLTVGASTDPASDLGPLVAGGNPRLHKAATTLEQGERWLIEPRLDGASMTPGIRDGVAPGSWFHNTECFGPILGLMRAATLDEAIDIANSSDFGLTGGIHSLDPREVETWVDQIQVGNAYVNRPITGAVVRRQPFGGWKRSNIGPGAKAGGSNYVMQLGRWSVDRFDLDHDFEASWDKHFARSHDETAMACEANVFRYRPLSSVGLRIGPDATEHELALVRGAAAVTGVALVESSEADEPDGSFLDRLADLAVERVRIIGTDTTDEFAAVAARYGIHTSDDLASPIGRLELRHYVREQAVTVTLHRFGNLASDLRPRGL